VSVVSHADLHNVGLSMGDRTVVVDGITENLNILSGLALILRSTATTGDAFEVGVGCYWDDTDSTWVRITPLDLCIPGVTSEERSFYAHNVSEHPQANSQLVVTNAMRIVNGQTIERPFKAFWQAGLTNPQSHADLLGKSVTFADLVAGTPNTISILIDGDPIDIYDVTNGGLISNGVGLKCDGATLYRFDDATDYCSGEFILATNTSDTDTATVYVSDGADFVEIATTDGVFVDGPSGIYLTGENAPEGVVAADESIQFQMRLLAPEGKTAAMNQRQFSIRIQSEGV
jgi:hypothetical protein